DDQLIARLASGNIYFRETAQRLLTERLGSAAASAAPAGASPARSGAREKVLGEGAGQSTRGRPPSSELRAKLEKLVLTPAGADVRRLTSKSEIDQSLVPAPTAATQRKARLHALWALVGSGRLDPAFHLKVLRHSDPACRAWGVRAAGNFRNVTQAVRDKIAALARDPSPDAQLQAAIASRKIKNLDALPVLSDVLAHCGQDKLIPSIAWNNLPAMRDRKSTRLNSSHDQISYAVFCLKKKK